MMIGRPAIDRTDREPGKQHVHEGIYFQRKVDETRGNTKIKRPKLIITANSMQDQKDFNLKFKEAISDKRFIPVWKEDIQDGNIGIMQVDRLINGLVFNDSQVIIILTC